MNFLIVRMNSQRIQPWFAEGIFEENVKHSQVGLVIACLSGLLLAVQVGLEAEHWHDL